MNINSLPEWIVLIMSSAGVSAAINVTWSAWTRHQDKKHKEQNAYLDVSSDLEDYAQACINRMEYNEEYITFCLTNQEYINERGETINSKKEPAKVEIPSPPLASSEKSYSDIISTKDRSKIKDFCERTTKITKSINRGISKFHKIDSHYEYFEICQYFEIQAMSLCGLEACHLAKETRMKSRTSSRTIEEKITMFESQIEEIKTKCKNKDLLLPNINENITNTR